MTDRSIFKKDLLAIKDAWNEAQPIDMNLPPGKHEVEIEDVEVNYSQNNRLQTVFTMRVLRGELKGKTQKKFCGMNNAQALSFLKTDLKNLGIDFPKNPEKIPDAVGKAKGMKVIIATTPAKSEGFVNIKFISE